MLRLQKVFDLTSKSYKSQLDLTKKENESVKKFNEEIDKATKLQASLTKASKPAVIAKNLEEVLKQKLGGKATPEIEKRLKQANQFRKQFIQAQKDLWRTKSVISKLKAAQSAVTRGSSDWWKLQGKLISPMAKRARLRTAMKALHTGQQATLRRGRAVALGSRSKLGNIPSKKLLASTGTISRLGAFSKGLAAAEAIMKATVKVVGYFNKEIAKSTDIVHKYSQFSMGGAHAAMIMWVGDIKRNIYTSRMNSDAMMKFAKSSNEMKDSWKKVNVMLDRFTLAMGTAGNKLGEAIGKNFLGPAAEGFNQFLKDFVDGADALKKALGPAAPTGLIDAFKKFAKFMHVDLTGEMDKLKEVIERRKQVLLAPNPQARAQALKNLKPDDFNPLEQFAFNLPPQKRPQARPQLGPNLGAQAPPQLGGGMGGNVGVQGNMPAPRRAQPVDPQVPLRERQPQRPPRARARFRDLVPMDPGQFPDMRPKEMHDENLRRLGGRPVVLNEAANGGPMVSIQPGRGYGKNLGPEVVGLFA